MNIDVKSVADEFAAAIQQYLIGEEEQQLLELFRFLPFDSVEELFASTFHFMEEQIGFDNLTLEQIYDLDLKKLAYDYMRSVDLSTVPDEAIEKFEDYKEIVGKFGRIVLFEILVPMLEEVDPQLVIGLKQKLEKLITGVSNIEGFDEKEIFEALKFDNLVIEIDDVKAIGPAKPQDKKIGYFRWGGVWERHKLDKLAMLLHEDYELIKNQKEFVNLFDADENNPVYVRCNPDKLEHLALLIYRLYKRDELGKRIIRLSSGKGYWDTAQISFVDFSKKSLAKNLKRLSSDINKNLKACPDVVRDVEEIIKELKKQNHGTLRDDTE